MSRRVLAVATAGLVLALAACGGSSGGGGTGGGNANATVRVGATLAPPTLDMTTNAAAAIPQVLLYNVYEGLMKLDDNGNIQPLLAKSYDKSSDGLTYTFHLRDAKFHNGDAFTADDVKFSFDRVLAPKSTHPHKDELSVVKSVDVQDPHTVVVHLSHPSWNFLFALTDSVGVIYDKNAIKDIATHPVGTGPYEFVSMKSGYSVTLQRFDGYWGTKPGVKQVVWRYFEDANALNNAELAGDIDIISNVAAPETLGQFKNNSSYTVVQGLTNGEVILTMNNARKPLNDVRVRQAITYAINRKQLVQTAYAGYGKLIGTHSSPADPYYLDLSNYYPYDPQKAKQLLAAAGYAKGLTLSLKLPPPNYARSGGQFIASQLKQVGITMKITNVEWPLWLDQVFGKGNFDTTIVAHVEARDIIKYGDPSYYWHYDNKQVQRLLQEADSAPTKDQMIKDYQEVEKQITKDAVNDWLFLLPNLEVIKKGIEGYPKNAVSLSFDLTGLKTT